MPTGSHVRNLPAVRVGFMRLVVLACLRVSRSLQRTRRPIHSHHMDKQVKLFSRKALKLRSYLVAKEELLHTYSRYELWLSEVRRIPHMCACYTSAMCH